MVLVPYRPKKCFTPAHIHHFKARLKKQTYYSWIGFPPTGMNTDAGIQDTDKGLFERSLLPRAPRPQLSSRRTNPRLVWGLTVWSCPAPSPAVRHPLVLLPVGTACPPAAGCFPGLLRHLWISHPGEHTPQASKCLTSPLGLLSVLGAPLPPTVLSRNAHQSCIEDPDANPSLCKRHASTSLVLGHAHRQLPGSALEPELLLQPQSLGILLQTLSSPHFCDLHPSHRSRTVFSYHCHEFQPGCRLPVPHAQTQSRGSNKGAATVWHLAVDFHTENGDAELFKKAHETLGMSKLGQVSPWYKMSLTGVQRRKELQTTREFSSHLGRFMDPTQCF